MLQRSKTTNQEFAIITSANTGLDSLTPDIERLLQNITIAQNAATAIHLFSKCSDATGCYVQLRPEYQFFPVLLGTENTVIPLYQFVEVLDEILDYDAVLKELPDLSYAQIGGAISFLRNLAQTNPSNINIDELEDASVLSESFLTELRTALADKEISRVLNRDE